jgi:hypothetical protein
LVLLLHDGLVVCLLLLLLLLLVLLLVQHGISGKLRLDWLLRRRNEGDRVRVVRVHHERCVVESKRVRDHVQIA